MAVRDSQAAPFVKWAGGKGKLLDAITSLLPENLSSLTYVEPFVGGGALLFRLLPPRAVINDSNSELINAYRVIRDRLDELLPLLKSHRYEKDYFYKVREIDRTGDFTAMSDPQRASRFIFLNKTCFNGIYRVNKAGQFNVPFGRYNTSSIFNEENLREVSRYLNSPGVVIENRDFREILRNLDRSSFVYLDPPYHPLTSTSNFTEYIPGGWSSADQVSLRKACDEITRRGIKFLQSNSSTDFIKEQYKDYVITAVQVKRPINSNPNGRGAVQELLIRNY